MYHVSDQGVDERMLNVHYYYYYYYNDDDVDDDDDDDDDDENVKLKTDSP